MRSVTRVDLQERKELMTTTRLLLLVVANAALLVTNVATGATPLAANVEGGWADCCKFSTEGVGFCCDNCCYWDRCDSSQQCPLHPT